MTFYELLQCIKDQQIKLKVKTDGQLAVVGNKERLTPNLISALKSHKEKLIDWLLNDSVNQASISKVDYTLEYDVNAEQRGMWLSETIANEAAQYNLVMVKKISGNFHPQILEVALTRLAQRQKVFSTGFIEREGNLKQFVAKEVSVNCVVKNLFNVPSEVFNAAIDEYLIAQGREPFNFSVGNLLRAAFIKHNDVTGVLCITSHHIAMDAWSADIFDTELFEIYNSIIEERTASLPELPIQYIDYVNWQHIQQKSEQFKHSLAYWKKSLDGAPSAHSLPLKNSRPAKLGRHGQLYRLNIDTDLANKVKSIAVDSNVTLFNFLFAVYTSVISVHSQTNDIVVGVPMANRPRKELESLIGLFINNAAIRVKLANDWTFLDVLEQVKQAMQGAYEHQSVPFETILNTIEIQRNASILPLIQLVFNLNSAPNRAITKSHGGLTTEDYSTDLEKANFELLLSVSDELNSLSLLFEYNTQLFDQTYIAQLGDSFVNILRLVTADITIAGTQLQQAESLLAIDKYRDLNNKRRDDTPPNLCCIHDVFTQVANSQPTDIAIKFGSTTLTYGKLNVLSDKVAAFLVDKGIKKEEVVGICTSRGVDFFVAVFGILKAGGAYLPIDVAHPIDRINYMLSNSGASKVLVDNDGAELNFDGEYFHIQEDACNYNGASKSCLHVQGQPDDLAYVIYTSGSTGQPKGVMIEHRGVVNLASYHQQCFSVSSSSKVLQFASFSFDGAVWEMVMALLNGASLHVCNEAQRGSPEALEMMLVDEQVSHAAIPPSVLIHMNVDLPYVLQSIIVAGEKTGASTVNKWSRKYALYNSYGPSESTVAVTGGWLKPDIQITVGTAIPNTRTYVLGTDKQVLGFGRQGELYVSGVGLARGYINSNEQNNSKFFYHEALKERLYATGDLARISEEGVVDFLGRADDQVKIRGRRIELSEIEKQIDAHNLVKSSKVVLVESGSSSRMVAFVIEKNLTEVSSEQEMTRTLRAALLAVLPQYMIPTSFILIDQFPVTVNGKIDTTALIEQLDTYQQDQNTAPNTDTQIELAHIWAELLSINFSAIYLESSFFELGGHSLLMIKLSKLIDERFNINMKATVVIEAENLEILALSLDKAITESVILEKKLQSKIVSKGIL
ncbi:non-ribosomal peptide synthetase [Pseudoalteromonas aurantia]|uniref:Carrier domain-containing protein n=1 Tax=Pseudoalteromonas aurantia TaxID=43654 RepID=A0ABY2VYK9_9GAMM|nr:non-ribosomal peptide synthetase [Pseudoalteromonas aurantia]TMO75135.1 hypothetical protein CWC20_08680 [Pseudoalteromonas aurantia]